MKNSKQNKKILAESNQFSANEVWALYINILPNILWHIALQPNTDLLEHTYYSSQYTTPKLWYRQSAHKKKHTFEYKLHHLKKNILLAIIDKLFTYTILTLYLSTHPPKKTKYYILSKYYNLLPTYFFKNFYLATSVCIMYL